MSLFEKADLILGAPASTDLKTVPGWGEGEVILIIVFFRKVVFVLALLCYLQDWPFVNPGEAWVCPGTCILFWGESISSVPVK